ncbi:hypothetical protein H8959_019595 [Pygathrix nigripes]
MAPPPAPAAGRSERWAGAAGAAALSGGRTRQQRHPAPAPTGARRAKECGPPDSPAPPSYLRARPIKRFPPRPPPPTPVPALGPSRLARALQPHLLAAAQAQRERVRSEVGPGRAHDSSRGWPGEELTVKAWSLHPGDGGKDSRKDSRGGGRGWQGHAPAHGPGCYWQP